MLEHLGAPTIKSAQASVALKKKQSGWVASGPNTKRVGRKEPARQILSLMGSVSFSFYVFVSMFRA